MMEDIRHVRELKTEGLLLRRYVFRQAYRGVSKLRIITSGILAVVASIIHIA